MNWNLDWITSYKWSLNGITPRNGLKNKWQPLSQNPRWFLISDGSRLDFGILPFSQILRRLAWHKWTWSTWKPPDQMWCLTKISRALTLRLWKRRNQEWFEQNMKTVVIKKGWLWFVWGHSFWGEVCFCKYPRTFQQTPGKYPRYPKVQVWKDFLHKQVVGLGHVSGVCWSYLRIQCI